MLARGYSYSNLVLLPLSCVTAFVSFNKSVKALPHSIPDGPLTTPFLDQDQASDRYSYIHTPEAVYSQSHGDIDTDGVDEEESKTTTVAVTDTATDTGSSGLLGSGADRKRKKLVFGKEGKFKVLSLSDMHFGERDLDGTYTQWGTQQDIDTQKAHRSILDLEKPDYVVFNGDLVTGENLLAENATAYLDLCWKPTAERRIPFSCTYGNHDNSFNITHHQAFEYERAKHQRQGKDGLSYTRSDVGPSPYGAINYWVPIYADEGQEVPSAIMWFFDSQGFTPGLRETPEDAKKYWVDLEVSGYVREQMRRMNERWGRVPLALVFVHIPVEKTRRLAKLSHLCGARDDDPNPDTQGFLDGNYTGNDLPFFEALVELDGGKGNVLAVTSGHDHGDSWCAKNEVSGNITLCFQGHSGHGGYTTANTKVRNGRVFEFDLRYLIHEPVKVETWNSYEDSTIRDRIVLGRGLYSP